MHGLDTAIFKLVNTGLASRALDPVMLAITGLGTGAAQVALSLALVTIGWYKDRLNIRQAGYAGMAACAFSCIVIAIFKSIWSRPRPMLALFDVRVVGGPLFVNSFPSGHTVTAWAVAVACGAFVPRLKYVLLPLAALVGVSRVYVGAHFPLDVVFGALSGAVVGAWCAALLRPPKPGAPRDDSDEASGVSSADA